MKKLLLSSLFLFVFRPMGSSMDWVVCKKAYRYECGIHAYWCNTHLQYKCLTNLESPDALIPREITQHELDSLEDRLDRYRGGAFQ